MAMVRQIKLLEQELKKAQLRAIVIDYKQIAGTSHGYSPSHTQSFDQWKLNGAESSLIIYDATQE
jgi:hypothetical protein